MIFFAGVLGIAFAAIFVRLALPASPVVAGFYRLLIREGVNAQCRQLMGTTHGIELFPIACPEISRETARSIADFCKGVTL